MSRKIDITAGPLSDEDRDYLDSRGRHDLIAQNDRIFNPSGGPERINDGNTGDIDPFSGDDAARVNTGMQAVQPTGIQALEAQGISDLGDEDKDPDGLVSTPLAPSQDAGDGENAEASDTDNYDDEAAWSYRDLQDEAKSRPGVKASGSRAEIIAALREDDASDEEPEDEDENAEE